MCVLLLVPDALPALPSPAPQVGPLSRPRRADRGTVGARLWWEGTRSDEEGKIAWKVGEVWVGQGNAKGWRRKGVP